MKECSKCSSGGKVDTSDLKSDVRKDVWVQVPPEVQKHKDLMMGRRGSKTLLQVAPIEVVKP